MIDSPCNGCDRRTTDPNCHDPARCEKWKTYREKKDAEQAAKQEAYMIDRANNLRAVKSKTNLGWAYVFGDAAGRRRAENKKRRLPGGNEDGEQ